MEGNSGSEQESSAHFSEKKDLSVLVPVVEYVQVV